MAKGVPEICKTCGTTPLIKHILSECRRYTDDLAFFNITHNLDTSFGPHSDFKKRINNLLENANIQLAITIAIKLQLKMQYNFIKMYIIYLKKQICY